ncbi:MAG: hypothetical protein WAR57_05880, partial [Candidatus Phosphoribacter sp.]
MRAVLVLLFPAWWRRQHGRTYRALLDQTPLTPRSVGGILWAAMSAWLDPRHSRLTLVTATALTVGTLGLLFFFISGWNSVYRQETFGVESHLLQVVAAGYAAVGVFVASRRHRVIGGITVGVAVLALLFQMSVGVPGWASVVLPMQVCVIWFMALS